MAYFSNGTEGEVLDNQCADCKLGEGECPIYYIQQMWNYDQIGNDLAKKIMNQLVSEDGTCQMFVHLIRPDAVLERAGQQKLFSEGVTDDKTGRTRFHVMAERIRELNTGITMEISQNVVLEMDIDRLKTELETARNLAARLVDKYGEGDQDERN